MDKIPSGALLIVVRDSARGNPIMVSHVGFVIQKGSRKKIRHATILGRPKGVREHNLKWYLNHIKRYKWKVAGVSFLLPKRPTDQPHTEDAEEEREQDMNKFQEFLFEDQKPEPSVETKNEPSTKPEVLKPSRTQ